MPTKRDVLHLLTRDELISIAEACEVRVEDRRVKDQLVDAVAASKKATLASFLPTLSRHRLKELCRALDLDDSGRAGEECARGAIERDEPPDTGGSGREQRASPVRTTAVGEALQAERRRPEEERGRSRV